MKVRPLVTAAVGTMSLFCAIAETVQLVFWFGYGPPGWTAGMGPQFALSGWHLTAAVACMRAVPFVIAVVVFYHRRALTCFLVRRLELQSPRTPLGSLTATGIVLAGMLLFLDSWRELGLLLGQTWSWQLPIPDSVASQLFEAVFTIVLAFVLVLRGPRIAALCLRD